MSKEKETIIPNIILSVSALPKTGKNHFAYSAPDPIKVYCFNGGAAYVAKKFSSKKIDVHNFVLPIVEATEERWALLVWNMFYQEYNKDIKEGKYQTYVFDTGTEIENFCQQAVLEELQDEKGAGKKKLATSEYLARNLRMNALFRRAGTAGVNLITLQYLKEEWVKKGGERAEPTGKYVMDGWKQTEGQSDINLRLDKKLVEKAGKREMQLLATITSTRYDDWAHTYSGVTLINATFDDLTALLFEDE